VAKQIRDIFFTHVKISLAEQRKTLVIRFALVSKVVQSLLVAWFLQTRKLDCQTYYTKYRSGEYLRDKYWLLSPFWRSLWFLVHLRLTSQPKLFRMLAQKLRLVINLTKLVTKLKAVSIGWDTKLGKMVLPSKEGSQEANKRGHLYTSAVVGLVLQTFLAPVLPKLESSFITKVLLGAALLILLAGEIHLGVCRKNLPVLVLCFNGHLNFYSMHQKGMP